MTYNPTKKDIFLLSVSYSLFHQILNRHEPSEEAYAPGRFLDNRLHTSCSNCNHLWLTSEDSETMWTFFKKAFESGEYCGIYADVAEEGDALILAAKLRGKKAEYCVLGEWAIAGTAGPNPAKREADLRRRYKDSISEAKLGALISALVVVVSSIGAVKVHLAFASFACAALAISIFLTRVWRRDRRDLKEI